MKELAIIIVNWNTKDLLNRCIHSIYDQTSKYSFDIYVVDNNSSDDSVNMVKDKFPNVYLISNESNRGFSAANNQALKIANAKNYLLLNPDTEILDNAIDKLLEFLETSNSDIANCKLLNSDGTLQKSVNSFYSFTKTLFENRLTHLLFEKLRIKQKHFFTFWDHNSIAEIDWARGAVVMFTDEVKKNVGLLDERFFIYGEEIDYFYRAKQLGYKARYTPFAKITHHGKASSKQRRAKMFIQNYKSFYQYLKKHYSKSAYYLYRTRVYLLLVIWTIFYGVKSTVRNNSQENREQYSVYSQTLIWHFTSESLIGNE